MLILLLGLSAAVFGGTLSDYALLEPLTEMCCDGRVSDLNDANGCCAGTLYHTSRHVCCNETLIEISKSDSGEKQLFACCLDENWKEMSNAFNSMTQRCCNGNVVEIPEDVPNSDCCGDSDLYDPLKELCCNGNKFAKDDGTGTELSCCGDVVFNTQEKSCCGGNLVDPNDSCCGDSEPYDINTQHCCTATHEDEFGQLQSVSNVKTKLTGQIIECCGPYPYDPESETCCTRPIKRTTFGEITEYKVSPNVDEQSKSCCGTEAYNALNQQCCSQVIFNKDINRIEYGYQISEKVGKLPGCCGFVAYDKKTELCCVSTVLNLSTLQGQSPVYHTIPKPPGVPFAECCGNEAITNITSQMCCNGKIVNKTNSATICCGTEAFNSMTQLCCKDTVYDLKGNSKQCCVTSGKMYDPYDQACCGDTLIDITDEDREKGRASCCFPKTANQLIQIPTHRFGYYAG